MEYIKTQQMHQVNLFCSQS